MSTKSYMVITDISTMKNRQRVNSTNKHLSSVIKLIMLMSVLFLSIGVKGQEITSSRDSGCATSSGVSVSYSLFYSGNSYLMDVVWSIQSGNGSLSGSVVTWQSSGTIRASYTLMN